MNIPRSLASHVVTAFSLGLTLLASTPILTSLAVMLAPLAFASPADLDPSFGTGGKVRTDFSLVTGDPDDGCYSVVVQADGKIVAGGRSWLSGTWVHALVRYETSGAVDTTFGSGGKVTGPTSSAWVYAECSLALQSDQNILVLGTSEVSSITKIMLARYKPTGLLDASFGTGGKVLTSVGSSVDIGRSVAVQSDGKILVVGLSRNASNFDVAVLRYTGVGALDSSFGTGGKVTTTIGAGDDLGHSIAVQNDGKIVVAGHSHNGSNADFALVRYTVSGALDASFGTGGKVTTPIGAGDDRGYSVVVQNDGKIVVAGYSSNGSNADFALVRYTVSGALDASFGTGGKVTTPIGAADDRGFSVVVQNDGKIVVGGRAGAFALPSAQFALARYLGGASTVPSISTVTPSPVSGSNSPQNFTINGTDFDPNCTVTLRDLATGDIYANRTKISQTATSITLNPNFGTPAHTWSVEVINPGPVSSGQYQFSVTAPANLVSLAVTGISSLAAGAQADYTATASFSAGLPQDESTQAAWAVTGGPSGTRMSGRTLIAGSGAASTAKITATYAHTTGTRTASKDVAIGGGWVPIILSANAEAVSDSSPPQWLVTASGTTFGESAGNLTFSWTLDGAAIGTANGIVNQVPVGGVKGTRKLQFVVTESLGLTKTHSADVAFNLPAINEPPSHYPPVDPKKAVSMLDGHQDVFQFEAAKVDNGLIIVTHGLNADGMSDWLDNLARDIATRLEDEGKPVPNIAMFDWGESATPSAMPWYDLTNRQLISRALAEAGGVFGPKSSEFFEIVYDLRMIKPPALNQGQLLADWITKQITAIPQRINPLKPIHLIGHSAGGFVLGEAAVILKRRGYLVDMVTMLDTPDPVDTHFTDYPNPGTVERYISSVLGLARRNDEIGEHLVLLPLGYSAVNLAYTVLARSRFWDPEEATGGSVQPNARYRREVVPFFELYRDRDLIDAHAESHGWYDFSTVMGSSPYGFWNSPFLHGPQLDKSDWNGSGAPLSPAFAAAVPGAQADAIVEGFQTFGNVTAVTGGYSLTEQTNSGIHKEMAFATGLVTLRFKYRFTNPGDGDFLSVRVGDGPPLYLGSDLEITRDAFVTAEVSMRDYAGLTGDLIFTLISRGDPNAVVQITDIELIESDDPDLDGLTITQEQALGTNPLLADTDGDGLTDWQEVTVYFTSPLLADSDGDGMSDANEITAGTNPLDPKSNFKIVATQRLPNGSFVLSWPATAGTTYRVLRSTTPDFASFDVLAAGIEPAVSPATYTDSTLPPGTPAAFYRVETE